MIARDGYKAMSKEKADVLETSVESVLQDGLKPLLYWLAQHYKDQPFTIEQAISAFANAHADIYKITDTLSDGEVNVDKTLFSLRVGLMVLLGRKYVEPLKTEETFLFAKQNIANNTNNNNNSDFENFYQLTVTDINELKNLSWVHIKDVKSGGYMSKEHVSIVQLWYSGSRNQYNERYCDYLYEYMRQYLTFQPGTLDQSDLIREITNAIIAMAATDMDKDITYRKSMPKQPNKMPKQDNESLLSYVFDTVRKSVRLYALSPLDHEGIIKLDHNHDLNKSKIIVLDQARLKEWVQSKLEINNSADTNNLQAIKRTAHPKAKSAPKRKALPDEIDTGNKRIQSNEMSVAHRPQESSCLYFSKADADKIEIAVTGMLTAKNRLNLLYWLSEKFQLKPFTGLDATDALLTELNCRPLEYKIAADSKPYSQVIKKFSQAVTKLLYLPALSTWLFKAEHLPTTNNGTRKGEVKKKTFYSFTTDDKDAIKRIENSIGGKEMHHNQALYLAKADAEFITGTWLKDKANKSRLLDLLEVVLLLCKKNQANEHDFLHSSDFFHQLARLIVIYLNKEGIRKFELRERSERALPENPDLNVDHDVVFSVVVHSVSSVTNPMLTSMALHKIILFGPKHNPAELNVDSKAAETNSTPIIKLLVSTEELHTFIETMKLKKDSVKQREQTKTVINNIAESNDSMEFNDLPFPQTNPNSAGDLNVLALTACTQSGAVATSVPAQTSALLEFSIFPKHSIPETEKVVNEPSKKMRISALLNPEE